MLVIVSSGRYPAFLMKERNVLGINSSEVKSFKYGSGVIDG